MNSGELNHSKTGTANLVPIAYGNIASSGTVYTTGNTSNFTCTRTTAESYTITITGKSYYFSDYVTIATLIGSSASYIKTDSSGGGLLIKIYNSAGTLTDSIFRFVVYKP